MTRKTPKMGKGLSYIIAALALLALTVVGVAIYYSQFSKAASAMSSQGKIEAAVSVSQTSSGKVLMEIYIHNIGTIPVTVRKTVSIDNSVSVNIASDDVSLPSGREIHKVIDITGTWTPTSGKHILVITYNDGSGEDKQHKVEFTV